MELEMQCRKIRMVLNTVRVFFDLEHPLQSIFMDSMDVFNPFTLDAL